eukprot:1159746-Pelagomonas_calceolata.AAC.4
MALIYSIISKFKAGKNEWVRAVAAAPYPVLHENCNSSNRCALPGAARVHAHSTSLKLEEAIDPRTLLHEDKCQAQTGQSG